MAFIIEDSILAQIQFSETELKLELSLFLYQHNKLTLSKACKLANVDRIEFQKNLLARQIPIHYSISDFQQDLKTIEFLKG
jgi:predicted HTH domain antitoxin